MGLTREEKKGWRVCLGRGVSGHCRGPGSDFGSDCRCEEVARSEALVDHGLLQFGERWREVRTKGTGESQEGCDILSVAVTYCIGISQQRGRP